MDASRLVVDKADKAAIAPALLAWYAGAARRLAWRVPPGGGPADPYRVWLAEIMLQQTTVAAATRYFEAFVARWPNVAALAAADDGAVMAAWAGLGYYARARNLLRCARLVAPAGAFPADEAGLRALPGVGAYTAAAIAAIAFGRRAVVVDANVERVVARLFGIDSPLPAAKPAIRAAVDVITPAARAGDFAQAMMDLGATICTARVARCPACPLRAWCAAARLVDPTVLPVKPAKRARTERKGRAFWITRAGDHGPEVWLIRRAGKGMLAGMRALPDDGWTARADGTAAPPLAGEWRGLGAVHHVFTHCALALTVVAYRGAPPARPTPEGVWWPSAQLSAAGLPTLYTKAAQAAMALADD